VVTNNQPTPDRKINVDFSNLNLNHQFVKSKVNVYPTPMGSLNSSKLKQENSFDIFDLIEDQQNFHDKEHTGLNHRGMIY
jgi:hypothetical protein